MRTIFWTLALLICGLLGYLLHNFIEHRKQQVEFLDYVVGVSEIAAYQARVDSLKLTAADLESRLSTSGALGRRTVRARLELLKDEIVALERTIEMWRKTKRTVANVDVHRQVVLLYGEASAAARALATDTMVEKGR